MVLGFWLFDMDVVLDVLVELCYYSFEGETIANSKSIYEFSYEY